jgi:hypothetical protein
MEKSYFEQAQAGGVAKADMPIRTHDKRSSTHTDPLKPPADPLQPGRALPSIPNALGSTGSSPSGIFEVDRKLLLSKLALKVTAAEKAELGELADIFEENERGMSTMGVIELRQERQRAADAYTQDPNSRTLAVFREAWRIPLNILEIAISQQQLTFRYAQDRLYTLKICPKLGPILLRLLPEMDKLIEEQTQREESAAKEWKLPHRASELLLSLIRGRGRLQREIEFINAPSGSTKGAGSNPRLTMRECGVEI